MRPTLGEALALLFTGINPSARTIVPPSTGVPSAPTAGATDPAVIALVRDANDHYARAQEAIKGADFETFGKEMEALQQMLNQLLKRTGMGE